MVGPSESSIDVGESSRLISAGGGPGGDPDGRGRVAAKKTGGASIPGSSDPSETVKEEDLGSVVVPGEEM